MDVGTEEEEWIKDVNSWVVATFLEAEIGELLCWDDDRFNWA